MDLLLAHGYFLDDDPKERRIMKPYPPLGLLYLSAYLKSRGFAVEVFDSTFRPRQEFRTLLDTRHPSVVGLYCNLMTKPTVLRMMAEAKAAGATVIVGGPEPPYYAEQFLEHGADVVVIGEGETALEDLLPAIQQRGAHDLSAVRGIVYRTDDGTVVRTEDRPYVPDLNALPWPDRAAIDIRQYLDVWRAHHGLGSISLITARGCPYRCTWCSHSVFGETHRRRAPALVADEVAHLVETYRPDMLWMADDVFTINHRWLFQYADEMSRRGLRIPFECISRADRLNEPVIETLAGLGCFRVWIGSESGSQRILDAMKRDVTVECIRSMTKTAQRHGLQVGLFVMLGYEGEDVSDIDATIQHLKQTGADTFLTTVAYPINGTPYYREVESRLIDRLPWESRTERDLSVKGRHSRRFYRFADRRMVHEVALHRAWHSPRRDYTALAKAFINARIGRWGMRWTRNEVEV
ncbi:MAG: B12-binding domain-containing radical SAM protein [Candidatus Latescibacteria bacterium]|nr:B12-binding domain-containing radical SAM protein [Candidatus Latescibacterota bacterium]